MPRPGRAAPEAHGAGRRLAAITKREPRTVNAAQSTAIALRLRGDLDGPALEGALRALTARLAWRGAALPFQLDEARDVAAAKLAEVLDYAAHQPFDLVRGPLLRVGRYRQDARDVVVLVVAHRVVTEACPMTALIRDLAALYRERAGQHAGESTAWPRVTCGDSVRLYRWVTGSRRPAPRQLGC